MENASTLVLHESRCIPSIYKCLIQVLVVCSPRMAWWARSNQVFAFFAWGY